MRKRKPARALLPALAFVLITAACSGARAQEGEPSRPLSPGSTPPRAELNYEVQLHLLVAAAEGADAAPRPPQSLDGVVRQLRSSLAQGDYRVAATFINRVRDGGGFDAKNAGPSAQGAAQPQGGRPLPTFYQYALSGVKLLDASPAQPSINVQQFRLSMRAPIQTASATAEGVAGSRPVIQYEDVGLSTGLSVREGEPTLVGTLGTPGQTFVIILTVRRAGR